MTSFHCHDEVGYDLLLNSSAVLVSVWRVYMMHEGPSLPMMDGFDVMKCVVNEC